MEKYKKIEEKRTMRFMFNGNDNHFLKNPNQKR